MSDVKEYYDLMIYPQGEQIDLINGCFELSRNVIREMNKFYQKTDTDGVLVEKSRQILNRFENRSRHHLTSLALSTVVGTLAHYRSENQAKYLAEINEISGFSSSFVAEHGLCCLFTKDQGEALLVNNLLLLPGLGTVPIECKWEHCFNKIAFMFIYRVGADYRARIYSSWPFEKPQKHVDQWLGVNFGKHKLLFLSDGRNYSFYHLLNGNKRKGQVFQRIDRFMYYADICQQILKPELQGVIVRQSQLLHCLPKTQSLTERYYFIIFLLEKMSTKNIKLRVVNDEIKGTDDFATARAIRHAGKSFEVIDIKDLLSQILPGNGGHEKRLKFKSNFG